MTGSPLASYVRLSPNRTSPRQGRIRGVAIHCAAGGADKTARQTADLAKFQVPYRRGASCHYAVGGDGSIAQVCDERDRAWCTSGPIDHELVTIEVASEAEAPHEVNAEALAALIRLLVDVCRRNGIPRLLWRGDKALMGQWDKQNMVVHRWTAAKACPGDTLYRMHGGIAAAVNERLRELREAEEKEEEDMERAEIRSVVEEVLKERDAAVYDTIGQVPEWGREVVERLVERGALRGDGGGLGLTYDMLRILVVLGRLGVV